MEGKKVPEQTKRKQEQHIYVKKANNRKINKV